MNHLPNILSLFRLVISPVFFALLISGRSNLVIISFILYTLGAITDYLDGLIARRYKAVSKIGNFFDPLADKFLTSFAFLAFSVMNIIPLWMVIVVILRDLLTTILRVYQFESRTGLITSKTAKWKTFLQMVFIFFILIHIFVYYSQIFIMSDEFYKSVLNSSIIDFTMFIITILSIWTLIDYGITIFGKYK